MDILKKPATSTPNSYVKPSSRRSIRDEDAISPIPIPRMITRTSSNSSMNPSDDEDNVLLLYLDELLKFKSKKDETHFIEFHKCKSRKQLLKKIAENIESQNLQTKKDIRQFINNLKDEAESSNSNTSIYWGFAMVAIIAVAVLSWYSNTIETTTKENYQDYNYDKFVEEFPKQHEDLWYSIEAGIDDAKSNRPSTFIFLYTNEKEHEVLEKILEKLGGYATCSLRSCEEPLLIIEGQSLNKFDDSGEIITQNHEKLKQSGVMIVKNLEQINHNAALAFHHICDQYEPLVQKSIIVFTMKVDKYVPHKLNTQHCEQILRRLWSQMPDDKFYPLYTRLSNVIYNVMA